MEWINVNERLPKDEEKVLIVTINCGIQVAIFNKGRKKEDIEPGTGIGSEDEYGNNLKPYYWEADYGPMQWFGQYVLYWMHLPELPNENIIEKKDIYQFKVKDYTTVLIGQMYIDQFHEKMFYVQRGDGKKDKYYGHNIEWYKLIARI